MWKKVFLFLSVIFGGVFFFIEYTEAVTIVDISNVADSFIGYFGKPNSATFGQTFMVPNGEDNVLDNFSFWMRMVTNNTLNFKAYVYQWDNSCNCIIGPALYVSDVLSLQASSEFSQIAVETGGIELSENEMYMAFFSILELYDSNPQPAYSMFKCATNNLYPEGLFYFNANNDFNLLSTDKWDIFKADYDLSFRMEFSNNNNLEPGNIVPEPTSFLLFGIGLVAWGVNLGRKKAK